MKYSNYAKEDQRDRNDQIGSRTNILNKINDVDLWGKVIEKAKDDIIYYTKKEKQGKLTAEEKEIKRSAERFLFDDSYSVPFDDYIVSCTCSNCSTQHLTYMSNLASGVELCCSCSMILNSKPLRYKIVEAKQISLKDLISIIGNITDLAFIRKKLREEIRASVQKKFEEWIKR